MTKVDLMLGFSGAAEEAEAAAAKRATAGADGPAAARKRERLASMIRSSERVKARGRKQEDVHITRRQRSFALVAIGGNVAVGGAAGRVIPKHKCAAALGNFKKKEDRGDKVFLVLFREREPKLGFTIYE